MRALLSTGCALAALPFLLGGCSNTCEYGSEGSRPGVDCKGRPAPTAAEANGWRAEPMRARIDEFVEAEGEGAKLAGVTVTNWGEVAFVELAPDGTEQVHAYDVDNQPAAELDDGFLAGGDVSFGVSDVEPEAIERVMDENARLHPGLPFGRAELAYQAPRVPGGRDFSRRLLSWKVTVGEGHEFVYYETDANGRIICQQLSSDGDGSCEPV